MFTLFFFVTEITNYVILGPIRPDFPTNQLICQLNPEMCINSVQKLISIGPMEQFTQAILICLVGGLVIAFPYVFWEIWRFLKPGLRMSEIMATRGVVWAVTALFLMGVAFAYFILCPFAISFFSNFQLTDQIENQWRIGKVISLVVQLSLAGGILFEMPMLALVLGRIGVLRAAWMRKYRRHAIVVVMILAGILTPTPDGLTQLLLAIPMLGLYEVSIRLVQRMEKKRAKDVEEKNEQPKQEAKPVLAPEPLELPNAE
jgi:sec-independent protein translocase protein TatC